MDAVAPTQADAATTDRFGIAVPPAHGGHPRARYSSTPTPRERAASIAGVVAILGGCGAVFLAFGTIDGVAKTGEKRLTTFALDPPPPEAVTPIPPKETPPGSNPAPALPQPAPPSPAPPVLAVPSVSPSPPPVATASVTPAPTPPQPTTATAPTTPVFVATPTCAIARPAYPIRAKRMQQTGSVLIAVTIAADGTIASSTVRKSSGYDLLDSAAVTTVRAGKCRADPDGRDIASVLTVAFSLDR